VASEIIVFFAALVHVFSILSGASSVTEDDAPGL
jgi:hypothetical protein